MQKVFRQAVLGWLGVAYNCVRPLVGPRGVCRFTPTCSQYAQQAVLKYGWLKGGWMALKRVGRCHPGCPGGYDPLP